MTSTDSSYFVFILGDESRSSVNVGMAGNLQQQVNSGWNTVADTPTAGQKLVYYEYFKAQEVAVARERQLKENSKDANFHLIDSMNPNWLDLSDTLY